MQGNPKIYDILNSLLADELTAINQYIVHSEMEENWGYDKLSGYVKGRAKAEMKHAETLIARIIFLEGTPIVSKLNPIHIGSDVPAQHANDLAAEMVAVKAYNNAVRAAVDLADNGTREMLESILKEEEDHVNWIEAQLDQIAQMGLQVYLSEQIG